MTHIIGLFLLVLPILAMGVWSIWHRNFKAFLFAVAFTLIIASVVAAGVYLLFV